MRIIVGRKVSITLISSRICAGGGDAVAAELAVAQSSGVAGGSCRCWTLDAAMDDTPPALAVCTIYNNIYNNIINKFMI